MNQERRRRSGCYWVFVSVLILLLVISVLMNLGLLAGMAFRTEALAKGMDRGGKDEFPILTEKWSYGEGEVLMARIPLQGLIAREVPGGFLSPSIDMVQFTVQQIRAAQQNKDVRAILLEVNSPGGAVTPTDEIYHALRTFRESREDRRIVVFARDVIASGAYYAAMAGDWIIVEPTSVVGSIGVLIQTLNWHELSERIGIRDTTIKAGANKDLLNPFREVDPVHAAFLQELVDDMHLRFKDIVRESRGMDQEKVNHLSDGRVLIARDAVAEGLIDEIGYFDDALVRARDLLGVEKLKVIRYERRMDFFGWLSSVQSSPGMDFGSLLDQDGPRFLYLWRP